MRVTAHAFAVLSSAAVQLTTRQIRKSEAALEKIRAQLREDEGRDVSDEEIVSRLGQMQEACEDIDPAHYRFPVTQNYSIDGDDVLCSSSVFRERTEFDARQFDIVTSRYIYFALLVLLATRNVVRTQKESKLAKLGIVATRVVSLAVLTKTGDAEDFDTMITRVFHLLICGALWFAYIVTGFYFLWRTTKAKKATKQRRRTRVRKNKQEVERRAAEAKRRKEMQGFRRVRPFDAEDGALLDLLLGGRR